MSGDSAKPPNTPESLSQVSAGVYEDPRKALERVSFYFEGWTRMLTESSLQMCYGLIGANWVVFGSVNGILDSVWAKFSLLMVILTLAVNVLGAWILSESLRRRFEFAEGNDAKWKELFEAAAGKRDPFPFTNFQESLPFWLRQVKSLLPLLGGIFLIIAAIRK